MDACQWSTTAAAYGASGTISRQAVRVCAVDGTAALASRWSWSACPDVLGATVEVLARGVELEGNREPVSIRPTLDVYLTPAKDLRLIPVHTRPPDGPGWQTTDEMEAGGPLSSYANDELGGLILQHLDRCRLEAMPPAVQFENKVLLRGSGVRTMREFLLQTRKMTVELAGDRDYTLTRTVPRGTRGGYQFADAEVLPTPTREVLGAAVRHTLTAEQ